MEYTPNISDPRSGFDTLLTAAEKFDIDRFIYAIQYKNVKEEALVKQRDEVAAHRVLVEKEYAKLAKFSQNFNKEFVTDDNQCFDTALILMRKLRSSISETKRIIMRFCPRKRRDALARWLANKVVSAYDYSCISADIYQLDLFRFEGYPDCVSELYNEMERFFVVMARSIQLCKQVLDDEANIRRDPKYCHALFEDFRDEVLNDIADIVLMIPPDSPELQEANNKFIANRSKYDSDLAWAPSGFHNGTRLQAKQLVIKQLLEKKNDNGLTPIERMLFDDNPSKVQTIRMVIANFDELLPDNYNRKHLPAKYIQMFLQYYGITYKHESRAVDYFNQIYTSSPHNKHTTVTYKAINQTKKEVLKNTDGCYTLFVDKLNNIFGKIITLPMIG